MLHSILLFSASLLRSYEMHGFLKNASHSAIPDGICVE